MPWDSLANGGAGDDGTPGKEASALAQLRQRVPAEVLGIGEIIISDVDGVALMDMIGLADVPAYVVVSRAAERGVVPKNVNVAARLSAASSS